MSKVKVGFFVAFSVLGATAAFAWMHAAAKTTLVNDIHWFNSLDDAKIEAKKTGKPILFLSMFGKIDEEMPCANARTLRATLFKSPEFKKLVSEDMIPAWEMVRPVPKVYIDLGNGKQVVRTVRGNAVMYVCNPDGKVVDAYPGIYTTPDFMREMATTLALLKHNDNEVIADHLKRGGYPIGRLITASKSVAESPTLFAIGAPKIAGASVSWPSAPRTQSQVARQPVDHKKVQFLQAASMLSDMSLTPMPTGAVTNLVLGGEAAPNETPEQIADRVLKNDSQNNLVNVRPVVHFYFGSLKLLPTPDEARDAILGDILKIPYKDPYLGLKDVLMPGTPK